MSIDEGKEAAIRGLHSYKEELLAQIEVMRENLHHVERSIELLSGNGKEIAPVTSIGGGASQSSSRYANLKGQAAVELFLKENPNEWFKAQRFGDDFYLYIIVNAASRPELFIIHNPAKFITPHQRIEVVRYFIELKEWKKVGIQVDL